MPGRPRKPTAVKKLQGTLQKCRTNSNEPQPEFKLCKVAPPSHLNPRAQDAWRFALSQAPEELLTTLDFSTFEMWCDTYSRIVEVEQILNREGMMVVDDKGNSKLHPLAQQLNNLKQILRMYITELGFSPASRSKVNLNKKTEDKNPFIDL